MNKFLVTATMLLVFFGFVSKADADQKAYTPSGNDYLTYFNDDDKVIYLTGLWDMAMFTNAYFSKSKTTVHLPWCAPRGVTLGEEKRIFDKFLADNPSDTYRPAMILYVKAMELAFPCKYN